MEEDWLHENRTELTADNYYQLVRKGASKDNVRNSDQGKQQNNLILNQGNQQQQQQILQQRQQWQQQQPFIQQQRSQSPQALSVEELQAQLQLLERSTTALVSSDSKNQLISQLHGDLTQLKAVVDKQNILISQFERNSIEASTRLRLADIDQESAQHQITQLNNNLNNCQARNQALITANNELRAALEETNKQKELEKEIAALAIKDFQDKEIYLDGQKQELSRVNEKLAGELKDALSNLEKVKLELAQAKQIPSLRNLSSSNNNNNDDGSNTNNNNNNNQSFISDELHGNNTIITNMNISMTSENMSERMKKYCADIDSFVANFLENKKYRVRSKQELRFFTEMAKMINFLKDQHAKLEEDFKEHMEFTNRKTEELKGSMVATLGHIRILKESTNLSITELEKNLEKTNQDKLELQQWKANQEIKFKESEVENQKLKKKIEELSKNIAENNKKIANLSSQIEENERNLIEKDQEIKNQCDQFEENKANYEQRLSEAAQKNQELQEEITEKNARIEEGIQREREGELREKSITEHNAELQEELKDAAGTIDELKQGIALLHEQIHQEQIQGEMKLQEAQKEIEGQNQIIKTMKEQIEELNQVQAEIKMDSGRQHEDDISGMQQLTEKVKELTGNLKELETKGQFMEEDIRTYKRKISSLESKKDSTRQDESQQLESALKTIEELQEEIENLRENPPHPSLVAKSKKSSRNNSLAVPEANLPLNDGIIKDEDIQSSGQSPVVSNRGSTTLEAKVVQSEQVEALRSENNDLKLQLAEQQEQVLELKDQLNSRDELLTQMTIEIQGIEKLHEESILAAKAFNVKRQEELENRVFELMQNNGTLNEQLIAMQTTINYLHQIDAFFDKTSEGKEQQQHEKILGTFQSPPGKQQQQQFSEENQLFQGTHRVNGQHNRLRSPVRNSMAFKDSQIENTEEEYHNKENNNNTFSSQKSDKKHWQNQQNNSHQQHHNEAMQGVMQLSDNKINSSSIQQKKMKVLVVELEERIKSNQLLTERVSQLESYVELLENGNHSMKSAENNSNNNYISSGYSQEVNSINNNNNNSARNNYQYIKLEEDSHEQGNINNSRDFAGEDNHLQNSFVVPSFAINLQNSADMYSDNTNTLESYQVAEQIFFESNR